MFACLPNSRYKLSFFKGFERNPIMVCDVDVRRLAFGSYPGNPQATVLRTTKGRQVAG